MLKPPTRFSFFYKPLKHSMNEGVCRMLISQGHDSFVHCERSGPRGPGLGESSFAIGYHGDVCTIENDKKMRGFLSHGGSPIA